MDPEEVGGEEVVVARDRLVLGIQARRAAGSEHVRKAMRRERAQVEPHVASAVGVDPIEDRRGHLVTRSQLVREPPARGVQKLRALASQRLGQQGPVVL